MIRLSALVLFVALPARAAPPDFDREIAPLLATHCTDCHGGPKPKGKLDLTRKADGAPLWGRVAAGEMPPKKPLPLKDQQILKAWVDGGGKWGTDPLDPFRFTTANRAGADWWSLQPVTRPGVPPGANPIDHFIAKKLSDKGLSLSPPASKRVLLRRLHFDLIGLPPSPEDIAAFEKDESPDAYEKQVEKLLASPHHGERWARHWLDVVRFGETNGFERNDARPNAWHYRDWVIRGLNADLRYDQFARLQLAGDVLKPDDPDAVRATGFLVAAVHNTVLGNGQMRAVARQDELEDLVGGVAQTFLGMTANCARCHDHKFDPIRQTDFYRLASSLSGVAHGERTVGGAKVYANVPQPPGVTRLLHRGDPATPGDVVAPGGLPVLFPFDFALKPDAPDAERRRKLAEWVTSPANPLFARVAVNRVWHYHFGTGIVETPNDFGFNGGRPSHPELLDWLANEFMAGRGGASRASNGTGVAGNNPPVNTGGSPYSLKHLHRLIVTSATYKQASGMRKDALALDADSRLLWRKKPSRLEGESLRDSMLAVSGLLNREIGGKGFVDYVERNFNGTAYYDPIDPIGPQFHRRSVYRFVPRGANQGLLDAFDCPDPASAAPRRAVTTTPLQALTLWNNGFALRSADAFAARVEKDSDPIGRAWQLAFQRDPRPDERESATQLVADHGLKAVCRALFNSNEFLTVE